MCFLLWSYLLKKRLNSEFGRLTALSVAGKPGQGWRKKWLRMLRLRGFRITRLGCALWRANPACFHRPTRPLHRGQTSGLRSTVWENVFISPFLFFLSFYFSLLLFLFPLFSLFLLSSFFICLKPQEIKFKDLCLQSYNGKWETLKYQEIPKIRFLQQHYLGYVRFMTYI